MAEFTQGRQMQSKQTVGIFWATILIGIIVTSVAMTADRQGKTSNQSTASGKPEGSNARRTDKRVSIEVARARAKLTHTICCAMLDVIHDNYFRHERSVVPSVAMEDAFPTINELENISLRWVTVNGKTMNVDHDPKTDFEKNAAKAISAGKNDFETVEKGIYRRGKGISLMNNGCLTCHLGFGSSGKIDRFSGLIVSIPIIEE